MTIPSEGPGLAPSGSRAMQATCRLLRGRDASTWGTPLPIYQSLDLGSPAAGVMASVDVGRMGLSCNFSLDRPSSVSKLRIAFDRAGQASQAADGSLVFEFASGPLTVSTSGAQRFPDGSMQTMVVRARLGASGRLEFDLDPPFDDSMPVTIQAGLEWATFLGGSAGESVSVVATAPNGSVVVAGSASSLDFPTTAGAFDESYGGGTGFSPTDVFISCLDATGSELLWSTYRGGSNSEQVTALQLEADGAVVVAGYTFSTDFPITPGAYRSTNQLGEGFVARLDSSGSQLLLSTFLGGEQGDWIYGMTRGAQGEFIVAGTTQSTTFPTTMGAIQASGGGFPADCFLASLAADGKSLVYGTYLGGDSAENAFVVTFDAAGIAYVAGSTGSSDFPTTPGAFDSTYEGLGGHVFVSGIDIGAGSLVASTLFGGEGVDAPTDIGIDPHGAIVVSGYTEGLATTKDAFDSTHGGFEDCFIAKFEPGLSNLLYSTYVGGSRRDFAYQCRSSRPVRSSSQGTPIHRIFRRRRDRCRSRRPRSCRIVTCSPIASRRTASRWSTAPISEDPLTTDSRRWVWLSPPTVPRSSAPSRHHRSSRSRLAVMTPRRPPEPMRSSPA